MTADSMGMPAPETFRRWLDELAGRDPRLHAELTARLAQRRKERAQEVREESAGPEVDLVLETIVRQGRPALLVKDHRITGIDTAIDDASREIMTRLGEAVAVIEPMIPLVGRIDVDNHAGGFPYVGTGWLIDRNVVATNRHVAELIARGDGAKFVFRPGRFGDPLRVTLDFRHELNVRATDPVPVNRIIWIETDDRKPDFALLEVGRRTDGTFRDKIELASEDARPDTNVVVIGYPARAPAHIIPDQAWMDRIYGGAYDVKRVAPGLIGKPSRGSFTHDATTLGGNSGSVVLDMKSGSAVALHFAGLYMIENYCVPSSTLRQYLRDEPWTRPTNLRREEVDRTPAVAVLPQSPPTTATTQNVSITNGEVTITIPLQIKVSLGAPIIGDLPPADRTDRSPQRPAESTGVIEAARALAREIPGNGVLAVRHGYLLGAEGLTNTQCLVIAAHPDRIDEVRARAPKEYGGYPTDVRPASLRDQAGESEALVTEAGFNIAYDDEMRKGAGFSFDWVEEEMDVLVHVGPERSWTVLSDFIGGAKRELVSSIYEFHATHIADALEAELDGGTPLKLVMAPQSRDSAHGPAVGDFSRSERFQSWQERFSDAFEPIFVPIGNGKLVAKSYHIKVTVRDGDSFWLSSGNWKRASQPKIAEADLDNPKVAGRAGNREWHAVIRNKTLAQRYRNHILADYEQCLELGGTTETVGEPVLVDVPLAALESIELERMPSQVFEPLHIDRVVRVKPLLTPDKKGDVYAAAVLKLIRSAKKQLLFQNQYITVDENSSGLFSDLVDALVERSNAIDDVRIILRSGGDGFWDNMAELKRRGMDVNKCVKRISATHTKGIIVDGKEVLVGSQNWSSLGVTLNRDASLLFRDEEIAQYFATVFEEDWERSSETVEREAVFAGPPRIADPSQPVPPGYVRMTLDDYLEG